VRPGQIVVLNGAPRSGKSSIVRAIQTSFDGLWMNLGVDVFVRHMTPAHYRPGLGLRPGEEGHPIAPLVPMLYAALYDSIAAHSRQGVNVVADVGHHDAAVLRECARRIADLPALLVGVRCPIDEIMRRRNAGETGREGEYAIGSAEEPVPPPVALWQERVHVPGIYDLEVDTWLLRPDQCAASIRHRLAAAPAPDAFRRIAVS
jgi:chloramphenicol 3-O phosphotransferase